MQTNGKKVESELGTAARSVQEKIRCDAGVSRGLHIFLHVVAMQFARERVAGDDWEQRKMELQRQAALQDGNGIQQIVRKGQEAQGTHTSTLASAAALTFVTFCFNSCSRFSRSALSCKCLVPRVDASCFGARRF